VQDAAYDSLLKSRRQELHGKIARVIEQRFPNIKTTEPEVLAHHLTAAGLSEAAIPLWQSAGELALKRLALTEAARRLNRLPGGRHCRSAWDRPEDAIRPHGARSSGR
jgi:predicted ATPase